ncbi:MAG: ABC transporter permease [Candidatus Bathyarchaeia archaeon]
MVSIARKNLFHEKTRLSISIGGVAAAVMLILFLAGVFEGFLVLYSSYIINSGADVWVASDGWRDFHSVSMLPRSLNDTILQVDGVKSVENIILLQSSAFKAGEKEIAAVLVGFNPDTGIGGPWKMHKGISRINSGEVIVDRYLAHKNDLKIGDEIEVSTEKFIIAGISEDTNFVMYQIIFMRIEDASQILNLREIVTFFLVKANNPSEVADRISTQVPGVTAYTSEEYVERAFAFMESFNPFFYIMIAAGFIVGISIIGITIYTLTMERQKEFGVLKAIGASNRQLYTIVLKQSLLIATLGFVVGTTLVAISSFIIPEFMPELVVFISPSMLFITFITSTLMGIASSYLPVRRIAKIDPAIVFKA